jgi:hypothetical protein
MGDEPNPAQPKCGATITLMNGEHVTPCHKDEGHVGDHEGYCLGSRGVWRSKVKHTTEEEVIRESSRR